MSLERLAALHQRGFGLEEDDGRGRRFVLQLGDVVGVVAADADNFHSRRVETDGKPKTTAPGGSRRTLGRLVSVC
jgi:hypothetical protein